MRNCQVRLSGRVCKLEDRLTATAPEDDAEVRLWAQFFASARRLPEHRETTENHILEVDRQVACGFFSHCQSTAEKPTIAALNKLAHSQSNG